MVKDMKKFISAIILMGQVKKDRIRDYWGTNRTKQETVHKAWTPLQ